MAEAVKVEWMVVENLSGGYFSLLHVGVFGMVAMNKIDKAYVPDYGDLSVEEKAELAQCGRVFGVTVLEGKVDLLSLSKVDQMLACVPAFRTSDYGRCEGEDS